MITLQLEYSRTDEIAEVGKFEWLQITYDLLRGKLPTEENEIDIAFFEADEDVWYLFEEFVNKYNLRKGPWSDLVFG